MAAVDLKRPAAAPVPTRIAAALKGLPPGPPIAKILPMRARDRNYPAFSSDDWIYEIKWDGWRMRAQAGQGAPLELRTKGNSVATTWFPEVTEVLAQLPSGPFVIDCEACVLDADGRSNFERLQARAARRRWVPGAQVTLMAFDIMVYEGRNVMSLPLVDRKLLLRRVLAGAGATTVLYQGDFPADKDLFETIVVALSLEGFVAKRKQSAYQPGPERSDDWKKIKRPGAVPAGRFAHRRPNAVA